MYSFLWFLETYLRVSMRLTYSLYVVCFKKRPVSWTLKKVITMKQSSLYLRSSRPLKLIEHYNSHGLLMLKTS